MATLLVLIAGLLISTALLLSVIAAVWWFDRYDREPVRLVAAVFVWGATGAPLLAAAIGAAFLGAAANTHPSGVQLAWMVVGGPAIEEALKAVAVVMVVVSSREFDNPTDGIVYGTAAGLGFAVTENALYGVASGAAGAGAVLGLLVARTFFSAGVHALGSATFGGFLGAAQIAPGKARRAGLALAGFGAATVLHGAWNLSVLRLNAEPFRVPEWALIIPSLYLVYGLVLAAFLHGEHRILRRQLRREVELRVLPPWVAEVIPFYRRRVRPDWWPVRRERTVLSRLITRLAFRTHAMERLPFPQAQVAGLEVVQLRRRIQRILAPRPAADDE